MLKPSGQFLYFMPEGEAGEYLAIFQANEVSFVVYNKIVIFGYSKSVFK